MRYLLLLFLVLPCAGQLPTMPGGLLVPPVAAAGGGGFTPTAAGDFDTGAFGATHALPIGSINCSTFTLSCWINPDPGYVSSKGIISCGDWPILSFGRINGNPRLLINNSAGAEILSLVISNMPDSGWQHIAVACDMSNSGTRQIYTNGVADTDTQIWITYSNSAIPWTYTGGGAIEIGLANGANYFPGCISEPLFTTNKVDLSANISNFIAGGHPADPTSLNLNPAVWFKSAVPNWEDNAGGNLSAFTEVGTITSCTAP